MNERLSLQDLIDLLAKKQGVTKKDAELFLRELIDVISETIEKNESVKIKDFGVFKLVKVNARKSVDVNTGESIEIPAHYKLSFNPDRSLKDIINRPFAHFESVVLEDGVSFENIESADVEDTIEDANETDSQIEEPEEEKSLIAIDAEVSPESENQQEPEPEETEDVIIDEELPAVEGDDREEDIEYIEETTEDTDEAGSQIEEAEEGVISASTEAEEPEQDREKPADENSIIEENETEEEQSGQEENQVADDEEEQPSETTPLPVTATYVKPEPDIFEQRNKKKRLKKLITLGFFVSLILLGFIIGGLYFQEIVKYIKEGSGDKSRKTVIVFEKQNPADTVAEPVDTLVMYEDETYQGDLNNPDITQEKDHAQKETPARTTTGISDKALANITIKSGDTLRNIAFQYYGNKSFWVYIYQENSNIISNFNNVPIGTKLVIPNPAKYGIDAGDQSSVDRAKKLEADLFNKIM